MPPARRRRHVRPPERRETSEFVLGRDRPVRRGPGRGPHVHLLRAGSGRRPDEQLEGPGRDARDPRRALPRLHARADDVRGPVQHGAARLAAVVHRRGDHRLALRRGEHAHDDPCRAGRARRARGRRRVRAVRALARRAARARPAGHVVALQRGREVDRPPARDARDLVLRLRLRRQRAPRQEVLRAAHRLGDRSRRGLARRAHAHPQAHVAGRRGPLHHRRVPVGLRQDQPRDAHPDDPRLEGRDHRRRHRVDEDRTRRAAPGDQPRVRLLRRGSGHQLRDQPERDAHAHPRHRVHQRRADRRRRRLVGGHGRRAARARDRLEAPGLDTRLRHPGRAPELPVLCPGVAVPRDRGRVGGPRRRPDLGHALRRPAGHDRPARLRVARLAPRRFRRRHDGLGEDRGRVRRHRRPAPRPLRDAPVLRLQHGRLLRPLALHDRPHRRGRPPPHLRCQLVPQGRGRQVPLARLRRELARAGLDRRAARGDHRGRGDPDRDRAAPRRARPRRPGRGRPSRSPQALAVETVAVAGREQGHRLLLRGVRRPPAARPHRGARRARAAARRRPRARSGASS